MKFGDGSSFDVELYQAQLRPFYTCVKYQNTCVKSRRAERESMLCNNPKLCHDEFTKPHEPIPGTDTRDLVNS